jgi:acetyl-CoA synthetase
MDAEDPLFILYTSGSTGKPKGVVHTTGGYLAWASFTHQYVFDYRDGDIYWCTADVGWVTGHSYIVYGPLANAATDADVRGRADLSGQLPLLARDRQAQGRHLLHRADRHPRPDARRGGAVERCSLASLKLLGSVGEPINPEAWLWYHRVVGKSRCPIVDTWWQTETGGILISPLPGPRR